MYTEKELRAAAKVIGRIARAHHRSEAQVRADMEEAMNCGRFHPDPAVRARWASFRYAGAEPTAEEFILWVSALAKAGPERCR